MLNPNIFRAYDIRGIAHKPQGDKAVELDPEGMFLIGKAAGTYIQRHHGKNLALGYDCRLSSPELVEAFVKGVLETGCNLTDFGMLPSPMFYFAVCHENLEGGACITASHNPKEYNGVKLVGPHAHSICGDELQEIHQMILKEDFVSGIGQIEKASIFPAYLEKLTKMVQLARPLKIVVDAGNGAAGPYIRDFFNALGCDVTCLYEDPDGSFPNHPANPEEIENMHDLIAAVKEQRADLGLAFDGDADRVGFVDEQGHHYSADLLLLVLAQDLLKRHPGSKVVFDVKVSQVLIDGIREAGGIPVMSKTGHSFIEQALVREQALLGGEISGHMFFAEDYYGFDDAFLAAARILEVAAKHKGPFSSLFDNFPKTAVTPELKTPCPDEEKFRIVAELTKAFSAQYDCSTLDGVRVNFDSKSWGAVRASNTSPNLTIRLEAPNEARLKEITELMLIELKKHPELDLWWENL